MERKTILPKKSQDPAPGGSWPSRLRRRHRLLPTAYCLLPRYRPRPLLWTIGLSLLGLVFLWPTVVFADPHAVFFTDRGQEQLFYNVLAALNQADYVEPPSVPPIQADQRLGQYIRSGIYIAPSPASPPQVVTDAQGNISFVSGQPLEPQEASQVELPRVRVRQVTSDDGDVYFRERLERRARAEEVRVLLGYVACRAATQIFGPEIAQTSENCPESALGSVF